MNFVLSSLSEGLLWSIMAIGVYLTFRILDIADMTAEGAFPLGAAVVASQIQAGRNPWQATLLAFLAGMIAGFVGQFPQVNLYERVAVATYLHSAIAEDLSKEAYVVLPTTISQEIPKWMKKWSDKLNENVVNKTFS